MEEKFKFVRKPYFAQDQVRLILPKELVSHLGIENGDEVFIMPDTGKHGKFFAVWKKEKEE